MPLMTKADYAKQKNFTKAYLSKPVIKEKLAAAMKTDPVDGKLKIDSDIADEIFRQTQDPARAPFRKDQQNNNDSTVIVTGYEKSRAEREAIKVEDAKIDLAQRKGSLLPKNETIIAISAAGASIREHLQARNRRIAEQASTMTDARDIKSMLDKDDQNMLETLSHDLMRKISTFTEGEHPSIN